MTGKELRTTGHTAHRNNFDGLRLVFALCVLYAHAYAFAPAGEPIFRLTDGLISLSRLAVNGFFVISGFLVWRSLLASAGPVDYLRKRSLRIFPALILVVLLTVGLLGPLETMLSAKAYWSHPDTWSYALNPVWMLQGGLRYALPGVFEASPTEAVNVSLGTIPYELFLYAALLPAWWLRGRSQLLTGTLVLVFAITCLPPVRALHGEVPWTQFTLQEITLVAPYFLGGCVVARFRVERWLGRPAVLLGLVLLIVALTWTGGYRAFQHIWLPPLVIALAYIPLPAMWSVQRLGDVSYGTYLAGWPVQQLLFTHIGLSGAGLFLASVLLAGAYGWASWHGLEKRALALKQRSAALRS